jgi:hypothetical protein
MVMQQFSGKYNGTTDEPFSGGFDIDDCRIQRFSHNRWDEKAGLERDALSSQVIDALEARRQGDRR